MMSISMEAGPSESAAQADYDGSDGAVAEAMQQVLIREEASRMELQPQVLLRSRLADEKRRLAETVARKLGVEEELQNWVRANNESSQQLLLATSNGQAATHSGRWASVGRDLVQPTDRTITAAVGEMWWARTDWSWPDWGMHVTSGPSGLVMSDGLHWNDGDLWQGQLQVLAKFILDPNRMPGGPGRFTSQPHCELSGQITGMTGYTWGDDWSKCWLHFAQYVDGGPGAVRIGEGHDDRNMFFIAGSNTPPQVSDFPGFKQFPRVDFNLDPRHPLIITLEVRLFFQMEGYSSIWFGNQVLGYPFPRSALLKMFQWHIQRI